MKTSTGIHIGCMTPKAPPVFHDMDALRPDELREICGYDPYSGKFSGKTGVESFSVHMSSGYQIVSIKNKKYKAHRLAWLCVNGEWPLGEIDHINRDKSDNRISNLRVVSRSENMQNRSMASNNTSGHKGVVWNKKAKKWQAQLKINQRLIHLGFFESKDDAISARKAGQLIYHPFATF